MSSFGAQMRKRLNELRRAGEDVPRIIAEVAEGATIEAVRVAAENTPASNSHIAGTKTRSGEMQQDWEVSSITSPTNGKTVLWNKMQYASYVNDGHRMDKHFVPGLTFKDNLVQESTDGGGLMVGVRTTYVPGMYMKEKAIGKYRDVVRKELSKRVEEAFR